MYLDTAQYDESVFYNGPTQAITNAVSGVGTLTVLTGPARLLTASLEVTGTGTQGQLFLNGNVFLRADQSAGANNGTPFSMGFPPDTILPAGQNISVQVAVGTGAAIGSVTYAYP